MAEKQKKVCMVVHEYYPKDFRVRREAETLIQNGYAVDVICLKKIGERFRDNWNKVNIYRLPVKRHRGSPLWVYLLEYGSFTILAFLILSWLFIKKRYDVVHVHNPPDILVLTSLVPSLFGATIIFDIHDRVPLLFQSRFGNTNNLALKIARLSEKTAVSYANRVIVAVPSYKKMLVNDSIPSSKITVLLNTADEKYFHPMTPEIEEPNDKIIKLFYHGTLLERYGLDVLVEAASLLKKDGIEFTLTIIGEGDFKKTLVELIEKLGIKECVHFGQFVLLDHLPREIAKADLCIVPNRKGIFMDNVLPTKLFEYIVMEKPVVVSRTTEVVETFSDNEITYFEPGDAGDLKNKIILFAGNRNSFKDKVKKAKEKYSTIAWSKQQDILAALYKNL